MTPLLQCPSFTYDALGRLTGRSINGAANSTSVTLDPLGRVTGMTNPLATGTGSFQYGYLGATGLVTSGSYPNGQVSNFSYYGNTGDERLEQIQNLDSARNLISQFNYQYDADGEITGWQQQNSALSGTNGYAVNYDAASQLNWATLSNGTNATSYSYGYDKAGNRQQAQVNSSATSFNYNGLNEVTGQSAGGLTQFRGSLSKWGNVTVGGNSAAVTGTASPYQFSGAVSLATGTNVVQIVATATSGVSGTTNYLVTVASGSASTLTYDADGEMTNNGQGQAYQWDAANRLAAIWYGGAVGSGSSSNFTYNGLGQRVAIVEKNAGGTVTSTKQLLWCLGDAEPSEERDASDNVTKRFYPQGEQISGTNYFYTFDHLGSVREMMDATGNLSNLRVRYAYDLWGQETKLTGTMDSDFGYAGYYQHLPSSLNMTMFRQYAPGLGRWISRDPIGEAGGINLYEYVYNDPVALYDPEGLIPPPPDWVINKIIQPQLQKHGINMSNDAVKELIKEASLSDIANLKCKDKDEQKKAAKDLLNKVINDPNASGPVKNELNNLLNPPNPSPTP